SAFKVRSTYRKPRASPDGIEQDRRAHSPLDRSQEKPTRHVGVLDSPEKECQGLLEFVESSFTLDNLGGHDAVKAWLREDTQLLKRGALHALPMGYLIAGRIGTGKTFLVQCWAGELGIPCVVFKNFRDRWVGATESNLEKIFSVLRALGQVVVFVDEADQAS